MARSSDSNNSNNKSEVGLSNAEHILDSIIEHIEATDEPVGGDISDMSDSSQKERMPEQPARPKSDFRDIEERAAQLASMLGGAGLAYSTGAKLHLSDAKEGQQQGQQQGQNGLGAEIKATIHTDDRQMDSLNVEASPADAQIDVAPQPPKLSEQERHVTEWEADTRDERITATAATVQQSNDLADKEIGSDSEEVADDDAPEYFDLDVSERRSEVVELNADKNDATSKAARTPIPDLENIEKQIEALSFSMREEDTAQYDTIATNLREVASSEMSDEKDGNDENQEVNDRVSSLEKQIVHLLDEVKLPDQKLKEAIADVMKDELPKAVQNALASSDLVGTLKTEIAAASEERRLQDVRLADSLDALHDALKDMSERVGVVESAVADAKTSSDDMIAKVERIASSVQGNQPQDIEQQHPVQKAQSPAPVPASAPVSSKTIDAPF